jgi:predicted phosphoadenosine phosphosulfate sulfurtransferase
VAGSIRAKTYTGRDVMQEAVERMVAVYQDPTNRVVVSFSAGKDSGVILEVCAIAAAETGRLPVEAVMRDDEIMFPGTFEYAERVHDRPDVALHWLVCNQPVINVFDRVNPYFYCFDPDVDPDDWVRRYPDYAEIIPEKHIEAMTTPDRFPVEPGGTLVEVIGLRADESQRRTYGLLSSGGYLTKRVGGRRSARPIYDWTDADVWKAIKDFGWDYNAAYDVMAKSGLPRRKLRIAPPTQSLAGIPNLQIAAAAWPRWFDRVCHRLHGVRTGVKFGMRAIRPSRRLGETWKDCFLRECIERAPAQFIADRARAEMEHRLARHAAHATDDLPDVAHCKTCRDNNASWRRLAYDMWNGDPMGHRGSLKPIEPEFFRPGSGLWGGRMSW